MKNISTSPELGQIEMFQGCRDIQSTEKIFNNESDQIKAGASLLFLGDCLSQIIS